MKIRSTLVAGAAAAALIASAGTAVAAPAEQRIGTATVSATSAFPGVLTTAEGCITVPVDYAVTVPATASSWTVDLVATRPDGTTSDHMVASSYLDSLPTGSGELLACMPLPLGAWTVTPRVEWREGAEEGTATGAPFALDVQTYVPDFKVKAKRKGAKVTITSTLAVKTSAGALVPVAGVDVHGFYKVGKKYKKIKKGVGTTNAKGVFKIKTKLRKGAKVKVYWLNKAGVQVATNGYQLEYLAADDKDIKIR